MSQLVKRSIFFVIFVLLFIGNVAQFLSGRSLKNELNVVKSQPSSNVMDKRYIALAAALWAKKNETKQAQAMAGRYARVVYVGNEVCVSLNMELGGAGEPPVYCFETESLKMTKAFDNVE